MKIKNKKAQIGATLTWIVAFLIIFFIMFLFISATIFLSVKKGVPGKISDILFLTGESEKQFYILSQTEALIAILKTSVEVDIGNDIENKTIQELIFYTLDPYIDENTLKHYERDGLIVSIDVSPKFNIKTGIIEKNNLLFEKSQEVLDRICDGYIFVVPQGAVYKKLKTDFSQTKFVRFGLAEETIGRKTLSYYNPYSLVDIHYRGYLVKIKYAQLINCQSNEK